MRKPENNFPEPTFYSAIPSGFLFLQVIWGRPALKSSKLQLSSRRVALNLTQNTFPLCRKKIPSILFAGATRPKSSKFQLTQGGSPRTPHKKNTLPLIPGAYVKNQIKFSFPLRELLRFLRQKPCVRGLFRRIS